MSIERFGQIGQGETLAEFSMPEAEVRYEPNPNFDPFRDIEFERVEASYEDFKDNLVEPRAAYIADRIMLYGLLGGKQWKPTVSELRLFLEDIGSMRTRLERNDSLNPNTLANSLLAAKILPEFEGDNRLAGLNVNERKVLHADRWNGVHTPARKIIARILDKDGPPVVFTESHWRIVETTLREDLIGSNPVGSWLKTEIPQLHVFMQLTIPDNITSFTPAEWEIAKESLNREPRAVHYTRIASVLTLLSAHHLEIDTGGKLRAQLYRPVEQATPGIELPERRKF